MKSAEIEGEQEQKEPIDDLRQQAVLVVVGLLIVQWTVKRKTGRNDTRLFVRKEYE